MTDAQPPDAPYEVGDRVRVRLADEDADSPFEGTICRVVHVFADDPDIGVEAGSEPDAENGRANREMARAAYRLENPESGEVLPVVLRHRDLVPAGDA